MNSLEEQLDYLNYQAEIRKAKQGFNISVNKIMHFLV